MFKHHDVFMRTTLTVEDSLAARLRAVAKKRNVPFKRIVNEALRRGLEASEEKSKTKPFRVRSFSMGVKAGIDYDKINQLLDDNEAKHLLSKMKRKR
jgi:hypothetical protein